MKLLHLVFLLGFSFHIHATTTSATPNVPEVALDFWNTNQSVQSNNNCYNYATNRETDNFAQPGEASDQEYTDITCKDMIQAASTDLGLVQTNFFPFNGVQDSSLIALVVAPEDDFHWYRRGADGMWTHKPGATAATNVDESGNTITNPETANRGIYSDFCGYFKINNYMTATEDQNGGFVRVGNMTALPDISGATPPSFLSSKESQVSVLLYSGRNNPIRRLRDIMADKNLRHMLLAARTSLVLQMPWAQPSHLGYSGVLIQDAEGLLFQAGTVVRLSDNSALEQALRDFVLK